MGDAETRSDLEMTFNVLREKVSHIAFRQIYRSNNSPAGALISISSAICAVTELVESFSTYRVKTESRGRGIN